MSTNTGTVVQVIGSTLDAEFESLPAIYNAIEMDVVDPSTGKGTRLVAEGVASKDDLAQIESEIAGEVEAGLAFALASPDPQAGESTHYVYSEN